MSMSWLCCVSGCECPGVCAYLIRDQGITGVSHGAAALCTHCCVPTGSKSFCFAKCRARAVSLPSKRVPEGSSQQLEKAQEVLIAVGSQTKLVVHCQVNIPPCISSTAQLSSGAVKPGRRKINKAICLHVLLIHHILFIA